MTRKVHIASRKDTLQKAAQIMEEYGCGALPVGAEDNLLGMVTDRDIAVRAVAQGLTP